MKFQISAALVLGLMPVSACAAEAPAPPERALTELDKALVKARAKLLERLEQLVFGENNEIDFRVGREFPGLLGQVYFDGECLSNAIVLGLGDYHPAGRHASVGLTALNGNGLRCVDTITSSPEEFLIYPLPLTSKQKSLSPRRFSIRYKEYIFDKSSTQKFEQAFALEQFKGFVRYREGHFGNNPSCRLYLRKNDEGIVVRYINAYFYESADYRDLKSPDVPLALANDRKFRECSYRSKFVGFGLHGGATIPSSWFLDELKIKIKPARGIPGSENYFPGWGKASFKSPENPVLFGTFNRLVANGDLANGRLKRGIITQLPVKRPVDKIAWAGLHAYPELKPPSNLKPGPITVQEVPE